MSYLMVEYLCAGCGRFESLESRPAPESTVHACGEQAPRVVSAVAVKLPYGTVSQGVNEERPPGVMDTSKLADWMSMADWKADRKTHWQHKDYNSDVDNGLRDRKVFV